MKELIAKMFGLYTSEQIEKVISNWSTLTNDIIDESNENIEEMRADFKFVADFAGQYVDEAIVNKKNEIIRKTTRPKLDERIAELDDLYVVRYLISELGEDDVDEEMITDQDSKY